MIRIYYETNFITKSFEEKLPINVKIFLVIVFDIFSEFSRRSATIPANNAITYLPK